MAYVRWFTIAFSAPTLTEVDLVSGLFGRPTQNLINNPFASYYWYDLDKYFTFAVPSNTPDITDIEYVADVWNGQSGSIGYEITKQATTLPIHAYGILENTAVEHNLFVLGPVPAGSLTEYNARNRYARLIRDNEIIPATSVHDDYDLDTVFRLAGFPGGRPTEQPSGQLQVGSNFQHLIDLFTDNILSELIANVSTYTYVPVEVETNHRFNYMLAAEIMEYLSMIGHTTDGRNNLLTYASLGDLAVTFAAPGDMVAQYIRQAGILRQQAARFGV